MLVCLFCSFVRVCGYEVLKVASLAIASALALPDYRQGSGPPGAHVCLFLLCFVVVVLVCAFS